METPTAIVPGLDAWMSVERAATHLGLACSALRRTLERRAVRAPDGVVEARIDGVHARKFGRLWRVRFAPEWIAADAE